MQIEKDILGGWGVAREEHRLDMHRSLWLIPSTERDTGSVVRSHRQQQERRKQWVLPGCPR